MRRLDESPPEVRALVADRLQYVLGGAGPRRSDDQPEELDDQNPADDLLDAGPEQVAVRPFGRLHLGVVAVLVLLGLLGAGWAMFRARPVAVATPVAVGTAAATVQPSDRASGSASAAPSARPEIVVHVVG